MYLRNLAPAAALLVALAATAFIAPAAGAQVSMVGASDPVYNWLERQRVAGNAPDFNYEMLPLSRGTIVSLLDAIDKHRDRLSGMDRALLASYAREFSKDSLALSKSDTYLQGWDSTITSSVKRKLKLFASDREPHMYAYADSDVNAAVDFRWSVGSFSQKVGGNSVTEKFGWANLHTYGTIYNSLGFDVDGVNAYSTGNGAYIRRVPKWAAAATSDSATQSSVLYAQAYASWKHRDLGIDLGDGAPRVGLGGPESIILRSQAPNYPWVRLSFTRKHVQFIEMYGALAGPSVDTTIAGIPSSTYAERWFALHRIQLRPNDALQFGFSESVSYSNRGFNIAYLNPVSPLFVAETDKSDNSDLIWYIDGVYRPFHGVELYGTLGIDDLSDFADIWTPTGHRSNGDRTTKLLYQAGATVALHDGMDLQAQYLRLDPYYGTHWLPLNTYQQNGYAIGSGIGPNADQLWVSLRQWLPGGRNWVRATFAYTRHGLNTVDSTGKIVTDVGGSIRSAPLEVGSPVLFLSGDLEKTAALTLAAHFEPSRSFGVNVEYTNQRTVVGNTIPDMQT
ncbi:MAG: capsule assembly Wzi family protein, partial [Gemmatimonadales bacterium]